MIAVELERWPPEVVLARGPRVSQPAQCPSCQAAATLSLRLYLLPSVVPAQSFAAGCIEGLREYSEKYQLPSVLQRNHAALGFARILKVRCNPTRSCPSVEMLIGAALYVSSLRV